MFSRTSVILRLVPVFVLLIVVAVAVVYGVSGTGGTGASRGRIQAYHADAWIRADGSVRVRETIRYDFRGQAAHGILRRIRTSRHAGPGRYQSARISGLSVRGPGGRVRFDVATTPFTTDVRIGDPSRELDGVDAYDLTYTLHDVVTGTGDAARFDWDLIGPDWAVPTAGGVRVTLHGPAAFRRTACTATASGPCPVNRHRGRVARFARRGLKPHEGVPIRAELPRNSAAAHPHYVRLDPRNDHPLGGPRRSLPPGVLDGWVGGVLALTLAGALYAWWARRAARDPLMPGDLPPGLAALVYDDLNGSRIIASTLADLARRGYLRVVERPRQALESSGEWTLIRTTSREPALPPPEGALLHHLFASRGQVSVGALTWQSANVGRSAVRSVRAEAGRRGWRRGAGLSYLSMGLALALGAIAVATTVAQVRGWPLILVAHLAAAGVFGFALPPVLRLTPAGIRVRRQATALRRRLRRDAAEANGRDASELLPYAAALGAAAPWGRALAEARAAKPPWFDGHSLAAFGRRAGFAFLAKHALFGGGGPGAGSTGDGLGTDSGGGGGGW